MEKLDLVVKRITVAVSNRRIRIIRGGKGFYHNFMSENGMRIIFGYRLPRKKYGTWPARLVNAGLPVYNLHS